MTLLDVHQGNASAAGQEGTSEQLQSAIQQSSNAGEVPPPPPGACFGRDELIEKIVDLAKSLNPISLIGPGGIGKTSVALAVLHQDSIKERFGDNRRFIRCDQFPASRTNFLSRLSNVLGANVENPENLTPLRPFLSSKEMLIVLDNAESILDPQGTDGQEIYGLVEELSRFDNICLCITSRISAIPSNCKRFDVPPLSIGAAQDTFYRICDSDDERSGLVDKILEQLDYHPLSVTLLATVAHQNKWDIRTLTQEWKQHQTGMLKTEHNGSLAVTIELSLASPMFRDLGPNGRELLGVVAFFPKGVNENMLDWLFPTISNRDAIFNKFCILSLTYRSNGFITMLAPLRDYLRPADPKTSRLLEKTKEQYFKRLAVIVDPSILGFDNTRWIIVEDANSEHLLDVFTSIEPDSDDIWDTCNGFMGHLYWHKPRRTILGLKIEQLPDDHRFKPRGLLELSGLFGALGNNAERKRLLDMALKLYQERGEDYWVGRTLRRLAETNRMQHLHTEGISQARKALEIYEGLENPEEQVWSLLDLGRLLFDDNQLDEAEEVTNRAIELLKEDQEFQLCQSHRLLGDISRSRKEREKAVHHYEASLGIASASHWDGQEFWIHHSLAELFNNDDEFDDATAHINQAKQHVADDKYCLGRAMDMQARIWYRQGRLEDAKSEVLRAIDIFENLGATNDLDFCKELFQDIINEEANDG